MKFDQELNKAYKPNKHFMSVKKNRLQLQLLSLHPLGVDPNMIWSTSCKNVKSNIISYN